MCEVSVTHFEQNIQRADALAAASERDILRIKMYRLIMKEALNYGALK